MPKKRKLNSKNPKYLPVDETDKPVIKERKLIRKGKGFRVYAVFLDH